MGNLKLAAFLAYKSVFKGNRWALALIVAVMSLSFANLLLTPSILLGVTDTINRQQVDTLFGNIIIDPPQEEYALAHVAQTESELLQLPGVAGVSAHLNNSALIEYAWRDKASISDKGVSGSWSVIGVDPLQEAGVTTIHDRMIQGDYLEPGDRDAIILGVEIAGGEQSASAQFQTLQGVQVGEKVRLTYANGIQREYVVKGIFRAQESQADRIAFVTREEMASVMGKAIYSDRASQILVKVDNVEQQNSIVGDINALGIGGQVRSWQDYSGSAGSVTSSFGAIASLISGIGLVVAGIVMFIVIYINVIHSRRHIGILRAIGIKRDVIIGSYLAQALFYAMAGIVLGGLLFGFGIQAYFAQHPLDLPIGQVSLALESATVQNAVLGLLAAAVFAGLIPVVSITKQGIIQAIWGN